MIPFWHDDPVSWDSCLLAGILCPGLSRIEGLVFAQRKLDVKTAPGTDGSSIVDKGYQPSKWTLVLKIAHSQELVEWENLLKAILPKKNQAPQALTIVHPQLALSTVSSCYIESITQLTPVSFDVYETKISCLEFFPLKKSGGSGTGSKVKKSISDANTGSGGASTTEDVANALKAVNDARAKQIKAAEDLDKARNGGSFAAQTAASTKYTAAQNETNTAINHYNEVHDKSPQNTVGRQRVTSGLSGSRVKPPRP